MPIPASCRILTRNSDTEPSPGRSAVGRCYPATFGFKLRRPQTTRSKDNDPSDHSRSGKARLDHHRILASAKSPAATAHPAGSAHAAGTAAAAPVHYPKRILTRCAMIHQSPTW
jgi:hypothetical protein